MMPGTREARGRVAAVRGDVADGVFGDHGFYCDAAQSSMRDTTSTAHSC